MSSIQEFTDDPSSAQEITNEPSRAGAIVLDVSNLLFRAIFVSESFKRASEVDIGIIRHLAWNIILKHRKMHSRETYPDLILAFDGPNYWRREVFPQYKKNREAPSDQTSEEADLRARVSECFRTIRDELETHAPFILVRQEGLEADDVMAIAAKHCGETIIVSGDKDMKQLLLLPGSRVWSPNVGQEGGFVRMTKQEVQDYLHEHTVKGDTGDGIPNVLMPDDAFYPIRVKRQTPIKAALLAELKNPINEDHPAFHGYRRNRMLVDFTSIPDHYHGEVLARIKTFKESLPQRRATLYKYFMANGLTQHLTNIQLFL